MTANDDLDIARQLIKHGIPVFVAKPALVEGKWNPDGGNSGCGYWLPTEWQQTAADSAALDSYAEGDALAMVCGHGLDALDVDPRHGGTATRDGMIGAGMWPTVFGSAATPSGGIHDFVASLGIRSRDNAQAGLDIKSGNAEGEGRGFVFIAPTVKRSKVDGELRAYLWTAPLDLQRLTEDGPGDDSGAAVADMVDELRNGGDDGGSREVVQATYADLTAAQRDRVDRWTERTLAGELAALRDARDWPDGHTDNRGRGWQKLCADVAHRLGQLAREPWNGLAEVHARRAFLTDAPTDGARFGRRQHNETWSAQHQRRPLEGLPPALADLLAPVRLNGLYDDAPAASSATTAAPSTGDDDPMTLEEAHATFRRWLGEDYDTAALDAMLATIAVERLDGDPLWLLLVAGSGNAKTETVAAAAGAGAHITSTIRSEGALLSGTPRKEQTAGATGGLLRKIGERGVLVLKDVTTILSMDRTARAEVLAALREIYDGSWERNVGTDGGRSLTWSGRIAVIGAVTTAWDTAHSVIASMGDRFVLVRTDSRTNRAAAGWHAIGNTGREHDMRQELRAAVAGVLAGMNTEPIELTDDETGTLIGAANLVTLARTGVEYDGRTGNVELAHDPEMPTRFARQLAQVVRGAVAVGLDRDQALRLAIRCARDSMPPLRLAIVDYLAEHPGSTTADVRRGIDKPRNTVDRQLQALHMLRVAACDETEWSADGQRSRWFYRLADDIDPGTLRE